jgi:hypothetical protein
MIGVFCKICNKPITDSNYAKDPYDGTSLYWADPKINPHTEVKVDFCGAKCSTEWHLKQVVARDGEVGQSQSQP